MFDTTSPSSRSQIAGLLTNKWALWCLAILTFQQLLESSSTLWLVRLMTDVTRGENFILNLSLYLGSLTIPYIPLCIASILKITWKQEAQRSFIHTFVSSNRNNIGEWSNKALKEEKLSIMTAEGPMAIHALIDYVWDMYTYALSVFFSILALSLVVEPLFAVAYGFSVTCVVIVMKLKRRSQGKLTQKALTARIDLYQSLLAAWDNVLLGNDYNYNLWEEKTNTRLNLCLKRNVELERFDQLLAIIVSVMTSIPSLLVVGYYIYQHHHDAVKLISFIAILPVLFLILSYTYQTLSLAFRWTMHRGKLNAIYRAIQASKNSHEPLAEKVKWDKIHIHSPSFSMAATKPVDSHVDLLHRAMQSGRVTLRGENGCGKSTALMLIKNALASRAFFLPTQNQLSFNAEGNKHSTGESLRHRLIEIIEKVDVDVLLLDEWDANLDRENQEKLSQLIDDLAVKKCVIEVRHR